MEKIDRNLIIVDMCYRIPYGTKVCYEHPKTYRDATKGLTYDTNIYELVTRYHGRCYLRPMSSMTEKEKEKYCELQDEVLYSSGRLVTDNIADMVDWLNSCHFDWRGLIPKGQALAATENMYNIK